MDLNHLEYCLPTPKYLRHLPSLNTDHYPFALKETVHPHTQYFFAYLCATLVKVFVYAIPTVDWNTNIFKYSLSVLYHT